ncbi:hypothetical protein P154DRAFT_37420 [Amniculicola lignicola CBS 123094]|uniref:Uncharacterized protein n=1 Tax=Amniculicola lignicola CBS 123094 TaxID=1392246 RepID=A0A6A5X222_9PLEO|nr:hypothetical protein P154DRAFT_37420 [Amniculicola lignicola CBS 123094]
MAPTPRSDVDGPSSTFTFGVVGAALVLLTLLVGVLQLLRTLRQYGSRVPVYELDSVNFDIPFERPHSRQRREALAC